MHFFETSTKPIQHMLRNMHTAETQLTQPSTSRLALGALGILSRLPPSRLPLPSSQPGRSHGLHRGTRCGGFCQAAVEQSLALGLQSYIRNEATTPGTHRPHPPRPSWLPTTGAQRRWSQAQPKSALRVDPSSAGTRCSRNWSRSRSVPGTGRWTKEVTNHRPCKSRGKRRVSMKTGRKWSAS